MEKGSGVQTEKRKVPGRDSSRKLMAESRDAEELKRAWTGWHAIGAPMRQRYVRMVELGNEGARQLGYAGRGGRCGVRITTCCRMRLRRKRTGCGSN